jgi:hypothetical protein
MVIQWGRCKYIKGKLKRYNEGAYGCRMVVPWCWQALFESARREVEKKVIMKRKVLVSAERTVIGTRVLSRVASFEGRFVVEHEVMMRTRDKKKKGKEKKEHATRGTCSERGFEGILAMCKLQG